MILTFDPAEILIKGLGIPSFDMLCARKNYVGILKKVIFTKMSVTGVSFETSKCQHTKNVPLRTPKSSSPPWCDDCVYLSIY